MTAFPEPIETPAADPWDHASESDRAQAEQQVKAAQSATDFVALFSDSDPVVRTAAARACSDRLAGLDDVTRSVLLSALESERTESVWRSLMEALMGSPPDLLSAGLKRLKAVAVLDPSDRKRSVAIDHLIAPPGGSPDWVSEFVRERMFSDESNYVRATAAVRVVQTSADDGLITFATQWLKHADLATPALSEDKGFGSTQKDESYFAHERRRLLSDNLGVRTTRSRAEGAATEGPAEPSRRGGPTLVQGHRSGASLAVNGQRIAAALTGVGGAALMVMNDGRMALGAALVGVAIAWAIGLQMWKWYRYG